MPTLVSALLGALGAAAKVFLSEFSARNTKTMQANAQAKEVEQQRGEARQSVEKGGDEFNSDIQP